jgi:type IV pilus assembly protein PilO
MIALPKGQREQTMLLVAIVAVAVLALYWWFPYRSKAAALDVSALRLEALTTKNQMAKSEMAKGNLDQLRRQLAEYQQNLVLIRTLVPVGNEVPSLLEQVSTAARRAGLDVSAVDPQPVVEGDNYDTYRYKMIVIGGYNQLGEFFSNVGNLTRIILPVNLSLAAPSNPQLVKDQNKPADAAVVEARFELETFVAKMQSNSGPPGPPKKGGAKK